MIKKVLHGALALLMILTVTGITINLHYCHDHLYDLALFEQAHSCCESGGHCHMPADQANMDHCEDSSIHVESTGEYLGSFPAFEFDEINVIELLLAERIITDQLIAEQFTSLETFWYQEPPPVREVDLTVIQTFLI
jgi:hypothetical protein